MESDKTIKDVSMAKSIEDTPILSGKDAEYFYNKFIRNARIDPKKTERNKACVKLHRETPIK